MKDILWIGAENSLYKYKDGNFELVWQYASKDAFDYILVRNIFVDKNNDLILNLDGLYYLMQN